jgi:hypothetical protein
MHHDPACAKTDDVALKAEGKNSVHAGPKVGESGSGPYKPRVELERARLVTDPRLHIDLVSYYTQHAILTKLQDSWHQSQKPCMEYQQYRRIVLLQFSYREAQHMMVILISPKSLLLNRPVRASGDSASSTEHS